MMSLPVYDKTTEQKNAAAYPNFKFRNICLNGRIVRRDAGGDARHCHGRARRRKLLARVCSCEGRVDGRARSDALPLVGLMMTDKAKDLTSCARLPMLIAWLGLILV